MVVENKAGAGTAIGATLLAKSAPDGYTLGGFNDSIMTMLPNLQAKMPWDILKDFEPVSLVATVEWGLVVPSDSPIKTAADLIAAAKKSPGQLNYGSGGNGSPQHIAMALFASQAGVQLTHVPYRGASQAALAVATGEVQLMSMALSLAQPFLQDNRVRLIGYCGTDRHAQFRDIPTLQEQGVRGVLPAGGATEDAHAGQVHVRLLLGQGLHPCDAVGEAAVLEIAPALLMELLAAMVRPASVHLQDVETHRRKLAMVTMPPIEVAGREGAVRAGVDILDDGVFLPRVERVRPGDDAPDVELTLAVLGDERAGGLPAGLHEFRGVRRSQHGELTAVGRASEREQGRAIDAGGSVDQGTPVGREQHLVVRVARGEIDEAIPVHAYLAHVMVVRILARVAADGGDHAVPDDDGRAVHRLARGGDDAGADEGVIAGAVVPQAGDRLETRGLLGAERAGQRQFLKVAGIVPPLLILKRGEINLKPWSR